MSELDELIQAAYASEGAQEIVNKFYVTLFRTTLYMPANKQDDVNEPFTPLYLQAESDHFIAVFDSLERLQAWAADDFSNLDYVQIMGADVLRCVSDRTVYLCLNPGTDFYKEFSPEEISRLKIMLAKIDKLKTSANGAAGSIVAG